MTELTKASLSIADALELSPVGAREMAASRLTNLAVVSLQAALEVTGTTQKALADILGLGESRVSQVVNGDGNIKLTTFARYLRALGYTVGFDIQPAHAGIPALQRKRRMRESGAPDMVRVHYRNDGAAESITYGRTFEPGSLPLVNAREAHGVVHIDQIHQLRQVQWTSLSDQVTS